MLLIQVNDKKPLQSQSSKRSHHAYKIEVGDPLSGRRSENRYSMDMISGLIVAPSTACNQHPNHKLLHAQSYNYHPVPSYIPSHLLERWDRALTFSKILPPSQVVKMGVEPPFIYDRPSSYTFGAPTDKGFNPKAATQASWTPVAPKTKKDGPLVEFNRHPDSVSGFSEIVSSHQG